MQILGNSIKPTNLYGKTLSIALILILSMSSALAILPTIKAQTAPSGFPYSYAATKGANGLYNIPTFAGVTVSPDPVGVGQPVAVIMIIELLPPSLGTEMSTGVTGGWTGYKLTVTNPNGTSITLGPYLSDVSGTYQVTYTPTTIGTYTFAFSFPGQTNEGQGYGSYYANFLGSNATVTLTVQQAPVQGYIEAPVPLPTQYWASPINAQNRAWNTISGAWLQTGYNATGPFNPYTYAPMSAHILYTKQTLYNNAGLAGGALGSLPFEGTGGVGGVLEVGFSNPIIMGGYVYYNNVAGSPIVQGVTQGTTLTNQQVTTFSCMDLQTGQVLWTVPGGPLTCGQILDWRTQQQRLVMPYLWSIAAGSYKMYDATTGLLQAQWAATTLKSGQVITPLSGTVVLEQPNSTAIGENIAGGGGGGALLVYIVGHNTGASTAYLACWNSTLAINSYNNDPVVWNMPVAGGSFPTTAAQVTTPLNWEQGIVWNVTIPLTTTITATGTATPGTWSILGADTNYVVLRTTASSPNATGTEFFTMAAVSIANQPMTTTYTTDVSGDTQHTTTGTFAWIENITLPAYDQTSAPIKLENGGNILQTDNDLKELVDYSESTGALLWQVAPFNNDFQMQSISNEGVFAYGMLYYPGYDGYMHGVNATTGVQQWDTISAPGGNEVPEPAYPFAGSSGSIPVVAGGGVVFCGTSKNYETQPAYRGQALYAYDATTGAQLWNISGEYYTTSGTFGGSLANGILLEYNQYDGKEYAFGRGQTATTVEAPMTPTTAGTPVIIRGTVTDQSPGAVGTPAISDAWMTPWMEYLYMDQPYPTQATGVNVVITAIDPNNNLVSIGNATSDISGNFHYTWTPPNIPGTYNIIATFNADNSYYGSCAETSTVIVGPASATPAPTATPTSVADMYFVPAIAGLFVLIIIVAIVLALLMLRKKP